MPKETEAQWLKRRHIGYCRMWCTPSSALCWEPEKYCPLHTSKQDLQDALEFSERVAARLANIHFGTEDCPYCGNHINVNEYCGECKTASTDKHCLDCRMKYARLKVEEEMEMDDEKR